MSAHSIVVGTPSFPVAVACIVCHAADAATEVEIRDSYASGVCRLYLCVECADSLQSGLVSHRSSLPDVTSADRA